MPMQTRLPLPQLRNVYTYYRKILDPRAHGLGTRRAQTAESRALLLGGGDCLIESREYLGMGMRVVPH